MAIFELKEDGEILHHSLTIRGLYKYVMECITARPMELRSREKDPVGNQASSATTEQSDQTWASEGKRIPARSRSTTQSEERQDGKVHSSKRKKKVTYFERLGGYLHPRDMRRMVTPISASNEPELIVRRHVMIFNFCPIRAVVLRDRMLVLLPDDEDEAKWLVDHLVSKVHRKSILSFDSTSDEDGKINDQAKESHHAFGKLRQQLSRFSRSESSLEDTVDEGESESDSTHHLQEWKEMSMRNWIDLPFELLATDSILFCVNELLALDTSDLEEISSRYIRHIMRQKNLGDDHFRFLRIIKDGRQEMYSRVKGFCASMTRTLNEDEDMALMNLSRLLTHPENFVQPVSPEVLENESDEPELILESHLQHGYSLMNTLDLMQGKIESASELWEQQLDTTRNKILLANMMLTIVSLCLAAASVVGSFLGMNVGIPGEGQDGFFMPIVVGTMLGAFLLGLVILAILVMTKTIQRTPLFGIGAEDD